MTRVHGLELRNMLSILTYYKRGISLNDYLPPEETIIHTPRTRKSVPAATLI